MRLTVAAEVAQQLQDLVPMAGSSSRATALAVVLDRLGHADVALRLRVAEIGESPSRIEDLAGAVAQWRVDQRLTYQQREALWCGMLVLQTAAFEYRWLQAGQAGRTKEQLGDGEGWCEPVRTDGVETYPGVVAAVYEEMVGHCRACAMEIDELRERVVQLELDSSARWDEVHAGEDDAEHEPPFPPESPTEAYLEGYVGVLAARAS
jgi:hypothetical protein